MYCSIVIVLKCFAAHNTRGRWRTAIVGILSFILMGAQASKDCQLAIATDEVLLQSEALYRQIEKAPSLMWANSDLKSAILHFWRGLDEENRLLQDLNRLERLSQDESFDLSESDVFISRTLEQTLHAARGLLSESGSQVKLNSLEERRLQAYKLILLSGSNLRRRSFGRRKAHGDSENKSVSSPPPPDRAGTSPDGREKVKNQQKQDPAQSSGSEDSTGETDSNSSKSSQKPEKSPEKEKAQNSDKSDSTDQSSDSEPSGTSTESSESNDPNKAVDSSTPSSPSPASESKSDADTDTDSKGTGETEKDSDNDSDSDASSESSPAQSQSSANSKNENGGASSSASSSNSPSTKASSGGGGSPQSSPPNQGAPNSSPNSETSENQDHHQDQRRSEKSSETKDSSDSKTSSSANERKDSDTDKQPSTTPAEPKSNETSEKGKEDLNIDGSGLDENEMEGTTGEDLTQKQDGDQKSKSPSQKVASSLSKPVDGNEISEDAGDQDVGAFVVDDFLQNLWQRTSLKKIFPEGAEAPPENKLNHHENSLESNKDSRPEKASSSGHNDETVEANLNQSDLWSPLLAELRSEKTGDPKDLSLSSKDQIKNLDRSRDQYIKEFLSAAWIQTLRNYSSSRSLIEGIRHFMKICYELAQADGGRAYLLQFRARAQALLQELENSGLNYSRLGQHSSDILSGDPAVILPMVLGLEKLFISLQGVATLTSVESQLFQNIKEVRNYYEDGETHPSASMLGQAFLATLKGPLSSQSIRKAYSIEGTSGRWDQLQRDLITHKLDHYLLMNQLRPYLRWPQNQTTKPFYHIEYSGFRRPIDDQEFQLERAEDLEHRPDFWRDGPLRLDLLRVLSDDMLQMVYRDPKETETPSHRKSSKVTVIIFDISKSMSHDHKFLVQAMIKAGYLDLSQVDVALGLGDHFIVTIPFGMTTGKVERLNSVRQVFEYYQRIMDTPITSDSGTKITNAVVEGYNYVIKYSKKYPELHRANVLFLTDGDGDFDIQTIIKKRNEIDSSISLDFHTINIGKGNKSFKKAAVNGMGLKAFGRFQYDHITNEELRDIKNLAPVLEILQRNALAYGELKPKIAKLKSTSLVQALQRLEVSKPDSSLRRKMAPLIQSMKGSSNDLITEKLSPYFEILMKLDPPESLGSVERRHKKLELFSEAIEIAVRELRIPKEKLLSDLSTSMIDRIKSWLEWGDGA